jgi:hypothetical protein
MPRRITAPENVYSSPERRRCVAKARKAAGKKAVFTEVEIAWLAEIGMHPETLFVHHVSSQGRTRVREVHPGFLAELMAKNPAATCRVILAAQKEAERTNMTEIWAVRRAIRHIVLFGRLDKKLSLDCQCIREIVKRQTGFDVSDKLIHKALSQERAVTGTEDADRMPSFAPPCSEAALARGREIFGSDPRKDLLRGKIHTLSVGKRDKLPKAIRK